MWHEHEPAGALASHTRRSSYAVDILFHAIFRRHVHLDDAAHMRQVQAASSDTGAQQNTTACGGRCLCAICECVECTQGRNAVFLRHGTVQPINRHTREQLAMLSEGRLQCSLLRGFLVTQACPADGMPVKVDRVCACQKYHNARGALMRCISDTRQTLAQEGEQRHETQLGRHDHGVLRQLGRCSECRLSSRRLCLHADTHEHGITERRARERLHALVERRGAQHHTSSPRPPCHAE